METKRILLLWAPLADYSVACFQELAKRKEIDLYIIFQQGEHNAPYFTFDLGFCKDAIAYSKGIERELFTYCVDLSPDIIIMCSWNYSFYMSVAKQCRAKGTYVISTFDGQWRGTLKQWIGIIVSPFFLKPRIDNFFVPGDRQANFAKKLGYKNPMLGYYSANTNLFSDFKHTSKNNFIFVGRLIPSKGLEILIGAYTRYRRSVVDPWGLIICGKGPLQNICENKDGIIICGFLQPSKLHVQFAEASCLILPSMFEPWGVVVHEAVCSGLAVIASSNVGAITYFVRDGQNGYIIDPEESSLLKAMELVSHKSASKLNQFFNTSKILGALWTTEKWAEYVYETISSKF